MGQSRSLFLYSLISEMLLSDVRSVHLVYIDQLSRCLYTEAKDRSVPDQQ